jgi:tRNA(Arg) A34 adenosine deaminase TadA
MTSCDEDHDRFMAIALAEAAIAADAGDTPVAAVIVRNGEVIATGRNRIFSSGNLLRHAETEAITAACEAIGGSDLSGMTLYSTMEPCPMCAWAISLAKIGEVVLGGRFASMQRTDLGSYAIEAFFATTASPVKVRANVRQAECETMRRDWSTRTGRIV